MSKNNNAPIRGNLSDSFKKELLTGKWSEILKTAIADPELDIQVRDNYLNIYYRGGNILRVNPRSLWFDKFYYYLPSDEKGKNFPKTYIENVHKRKHDEIPPKPTLPVPSEEEADRIIEALDEKLSEIMKLLPGSPQEFFDKTKKVMDDWFAKWHKEERNDQHYISLANRTFADGSDFVVVDLEFAVSRNKEYNHAKSKRSGKGKACRFDIIAVDQSGQIYVIELKQNEEADSEQNTANIKVHRKDFDDTIGYDSENLFAKEIAGLVEAKKALGLLEQNVNVNVSKPIFAISYSGRNAEHFYEKYKGGDIPIIRIDENKKLCK